MQTLRHARVPVAGVVVGLIACLGCVPPRSTSSSMYSGSTTTSTGPCRYDYETKTYNENEQKIAALDAGKRPKNFKKPIDDYFDTALKDPPSRKVKWGTNPGDNLVCGTINSKNSYGAYTGAQPFIAWFDSAGKLQEVALLSGRDAETFSKSSSLCDIGHVYYTLLKRCGFI